MTGLRSAWAHPRSRGENTYVVTPWCYAEGSSPLTRGKPGVARLARNRRRLIPAHAGKTHSSEPDLNGGGAHPRSRGENEIIMTDTIKPTGSSPLTRGKRSVEPLLHERGGLIPAHAGKTLGAAPGRGGAWAHPRSRGENFSSSAGAAGAAGSSPLTRGKLHDPGQEGHRPGLIPAHAGKTCHCPAIRPCSWAHPRSRGENRLPVGRPGRLEGSSPLTRGKHVQEIELAPVLGLIPAHAGKTPSSRPLASSRRAHPRSRGENLPLSWEPPMLVGSSPLTRGKPRGAGAALHRRGLIPAHAGKTTVARTRTWQEWAHPRSRGENDELARALRNLAGSSPLTRGKRRRNRVRRIDAGLIPAHAGKTYYEKRTGQPITAHPRSRGENA